MNADTRLDPRSARTMLAVLAALCGLLIAAGQASATTSPASGAAGAHGESDVDPRAAAALANEKGISIAEARRRLGRERGLAAAGARVEASLDGRTGGIYLDEDGELVVTTLDPAADTIVARSGARPVRVDDNSARLDAIVARLDRQAEAGDIGTVQGWYVDVPANTVVITLTEGALDSGTAEILKLAKSFGDSVRIEHRPADEAPRAAAEYLVGGFEFVLSDNVHVCSVGFNTLDAWNRHVVLTAGHCVTSAGNLSRNGYVIGAARTADFPGDDFGTFWNSYPSYWVPSPSVYLYDGTYARVAGQWDNPPVGTTVCKSGRTTGYTCGKITAVGQTVRFDDGNVIYGLVRHSACVEGGDSGGANISAGYYALGVTSGAQTRYEKCLAKFGSPNVSWYQPVGEALTRNGLKLLR